MRERDLRRALGNARATAVVNRRLGGTALLLLALAAAMLALIAGPSAVREAKAAGDPSSWQITGAPFRQTMTVGDTGISSRLQDFPVKLELTPSNFNYADDSPDQTAADAVSTDLAFVASTDSA